jgi:hypothetical protein
MRRFHAGEKVVDLERARVAARCYAGEMHGWEIPL